MEQYFKLIEDILQEGHKRDNRTGISSLSLFGSQIKFSLSDQFPLVPIKNMSFYNVVHELLWMLSGEKNIHYLQRHGITKWADLADAEGNLGPFYGSLWRNWETKDGHIIDQITNAIEQIKNSPDSRRILVNAWNLGEVEHMKLPPCHFAFQFHVIDEKLSCMVFMRSLDAYNAGPYNIASYALLTNMVASFCNLKPGELIISSADTHIYENNIVDARNLIRNIPSNPSKLLIRRRPETFDDFKFEDFDIL